MKHSLLILGSLLGAFCLGQAPALADTIVSVTETHYDANLRPDCVALRMNPLTFADAPSNACTPKSAVSANGPDRITQTVYDNAGQVKAVYRGVGTSSIIQYAYYDYTPNGLKAFEIDANHNKTTYTYDGFDRLSKIQYPNTTAGNETSSTTDYEQFAYDSNGNKTWWRRRNGVYLYYNYDNLNREILSYPGDSSIPNLYTGYDGLGHILWKRSGNNTPSTPGVSYTYDALGRVVSTTDFNNRTITYAYNAASARTRLTFPEGNYVQYTLDYLNRVTSVGLNGTTNVLFGQVFDNLGRRTSLMRGTSSVGGATTYGYDNLCRLTSLTNNLSGTAYDITWTFSGRNPANQIVTWAATSTVYDYVETATATTAKTYDGLNRDSTIAALSGGYDTKGNLAKDGTRTMTYDIYNRLLTVTGTGMNIKMVYDTEGRLAKYSVDGGTTYTTFLYDGTSLIGEYNNAGAMTRRYILGTGVDEPVVWYNGSGVTASDQRFFYQNYQGSVIAYTDSAGIMGGYYKYGPYGEPKNASDAPNWPGTRYAYTGQLALGEAGLYYYKARVYDPNFGRFLQTDPVGSKDDLDLYAYVGGDPINRSDPSGLYGWDETGDYLAGVAKGALREVAHANTQAANLLGGPLLGAYAGAQEKFINSALPVSTSTYGAIGENAGRLAGVTALMVTPAGAEAMLGKSATATVDLASLAGRADTIHGALDPIAQSMRTTAVVQTGEGGTFVGSSQNLLSPAQRALLQPGEIAARGAGHAEMTAVRAAEAAGQNPVAVGVSRPPCANCAAELTKRGIAY